MSRVIVLLAVLAATSAFGALLVSSERGTDDPVQVDAPGGKSEPAIAWGGGVGLVAWNDGRNRRSSSIFAARIDDTGKLLDPGGLEIAALGSRPAVAFDGTNFLVVFQRQLSAFDESDVYAIRVSPQGQLVDSAPFVITSASGDDLHASVAFLPGQYLVTWERSSAAGSFIFGARVTPAGAVLDPTPIVISQAASDRGHPSVTAGAADFFVAWQDFRNVARQTFGARVSPAGVVRDPAGLAVSPPAARTQPPSVGFDGTRFWVSWALEDRSAIDAVRLEADGTLTDATPLRVHAQGGSHQDPVITCGSGQCAVAWTDLPEVYAARLSAAGVLLTSAASPLDLGPTENLGTTGNEFPRSSPGLAFTGSVFVAGLLSKCVPQANGCRGFGVVAQPFALDAPATPLPPRQRVSTAANVQLTPSLAFNGASTLLAWVDDRRDELDIYASRVDGSGAPLGTTAIAVSTASEQQLEPRVAALGSDFLVVWSDRRGGASYDIFGARVSGSGVLLDPTGIAISTAAGDQRAPCVASDGIGWFIAWSDTRTGATPQLYGARLSATGTLLDLAGFPLVTSTAQLGEPALAFDGTRYLLAWSEITATTSSIQASRLGSAGARLDTPPLQLGAGGRVPAVASTRDGFLVAWRAATGTGTAVSATRVGASGAVSTPTLLASSPIASGAAPALTSDGTNFLALWEQPLTAGTAELRARQLSGAGALLDTAPFTVASARQDVLFLPLGLAVSSSGPRHFLTADSRMHPERPLGNQRITVRDLSVQPQGAACSGDHECATGFCADGVCCDTRCGGCQICSKSAGASADGTCTVIPTTAICRAASGPCDVEERCDGKSGACPPDLAVSDGASCSDQDACTAGDTCQAGVCVGGAPQRCAQGRECEEPGVCSPATGCVYRARPEGTPCSVGTCRGSVCEAPAAKPDAATPPPDGSTTGNTPASGCGCSSGDAAWPLVALVAILPLRRRRERS